MVYKLNPTPGDPREIKIKKSRKTGNESEGKKNERCPRYENG